MEQGQAEKFVFDLLSMMIEKKHRICLLQQVFRQR